MRYCARSIAISFVIGVAVLAGCGESRTGDRATVVLTTTPNNTDSSGPVLTSPPTVEAPPVTAPSPEASAFVVDGPLVTNGPPWSCVAAATDCSSPDANLIGTIELVDDCILVHESEFDTMQFVIFEYGVSWDDATQTIVGLGAEPVHIGDEVNHLANAADRLDEWLARYRLPSAPEKVHECMSIAQAEHVFWNTPWF